MIQRCAVLLLAIACTWVCSAPASACSAPRDCRALLVVAPSDDAADVPRNVELRVSYGNTWYSSTGSEPQPILETADGVVVATQWSRVTAYSYSAQLNETWRGRPDAPLAPSTRYQIRHAYTQCPGDGGYGSGYCGLCKAETTGDVIAEFTTGTSTLAQTPPAPRIGELSAPVSSHEPNTSCGLISRCSQSVTVSGLATKMPLRVYKDDVWQGDYYGTTLSFGFAGAWPGQGPDIRGDGEYELFAVDQAGNRSDPVTLLVSGCGQVSPRDAGFPPYPYGDAGSEPGAGGTGLDAGTEPTHDTNVTEPDATPETSAITSDDGCALGNARSSPLWAALGLLALVRRRRPLTRH
jgi:hypothetical protein